MARAVNPQSLAGLLRGMGGPFGSDLDVKVRLRQKSSSRIDSSEGGASHVKEAQPLVNWARGRLVKQVICAGLGLISLEPGGQDVRDRDRRKVSVSLEPEVHARFEAWRTARSLRAATALLQMVDQVLAGDVPERHGRASGQGEPDNAASHPRSLSAGTSPGDRAVAVPEDLVRELRLVRRTAMWRRLLEDGTFEESFDEPVKD